jgi:two-component system, chemotaxis family, CheB/CheR fusion protein
MGEINSNPQLVAIGCSAGGIEALSTLVASLKTPFPAPIVVAQHLDPKRPSHLAEVLSRRSTLPVRTVDGVTPLENGTIYLIPPGQDVVVEGHALNLAREDGERPKPSINVLFRSAADAYGENLIAVILTGTGSDGTAGARHVKACGGTVVIENPETASFPGMPESLPSCAVDVVVDLERVGSVLYELLTGAYIEPQPADEQRLHELLDLVRDRSGIDFKRYKQATILRRMRSRITATDTENLDGYLTYLGTHADEYQRLVNSFLIKVTEFMRDPDLFAYLKETILPSLVERSRRESRLLRIWSAGCATGEEAYSLAILVCEVLGEELDEFNIRIFATDIDTEAVAFARRGVYPPSAVSDLPAELVERYFQLAGGQYQIRKRVRNLTVFGEHDLGQRAPFPHIDLVMCRNVLIYFTSELQRRALQLFAFSLRDDGYLVLGKAETTSPLGEFFTAHDLHQKVYLRRGERVVVPPAPVVAPPKRSLRARVPPPPPLRAAKEVPRSRVPIDALLSSLPFGAVLIDGRYDILEINFAARRLLGIHGPAFGQDFVHLAQMVPHRALLEAVDAALRGEAPEPVEVLVESTPPGDPHFLRITCCPRHADPEGPKLDCALIVVADVTPEAKKHSEMDRALAREIAARNEMAEAMADTEAERAGLRAEVERLRRQSAERGAALERAEAERREDRANAERLADANRRLLRANEELAAAHEQVRISNEELMLSSEESQAATEEVETLNEELQSTNEELETLNEELQSTIEELNTTNADLEARSREMSAPIEAERARLSAILRSMGDGLLLVDGEGKPVLVNDAYRRMFADGRPPLADARGKPLLPEATPEQRAARGEHFQMEFTLPSEGGAPRHFEATGHPIGEASGTKLGGGVIVIRDITERSIRRQQERFMAMASHELRTPLVPLHGYLDLLAHAATKLDDGEKIVRYANLARVQGERLERLIGDLVTATRLQTGKFQLKLAKMELAPVVERAVESVRAGAPSLRIDVDLPADGPPLLVNGDDTRLEQVVTNLLANAQNHAASSPRVDVRLDRAGNEAELIVEDFGPGIPPADLPHIFSSFYQVERANRPSRGGMGLGLYICQEIAKAHGGRVLVRSEEGKGTIFTVRLPLAGAEATQA